MFDYAEREKLAMIEFKSIIINYIAPLFDVRGTLKCKKGPCNNKELISIHDNANGRIVRFYPCVASEAFTTPFYCEIGTYSTNAIINSAKQILSELLKVAEFNCSNGMIRKRNRYGSGSSRQATYKQRTFGIAFELGMCFALTPNYEDACALHAIVVKMIAWASRTYEGKNVPFGIAIDFDLTLSSKNADYLHFLENDSSAVFTDGVFSGIMLDRKGKIKSFLTRNTPAPEIDADCQIFVPYQFADFAKHCIKNIVGIVVLTNGEIILIKNRAVVFAKRGSKWVRFDWSRVKNGLKPYFEQSNTIDKFELDRRIKVIYSTLLDVSFAHSGGCLALVLPNPSEELDNIIRERFDLATRGKAPKGISLESKERINILNHLLKTQSHKVPSFFDIEQPLRCEILSLDGATVVSLDGSFYCAGSIVSVRSGSSGGGRTAAAKKLAELGVGIKISEDGYIEAYGIPLNNELYTKKNARIIPLFKIK